jgi:hypothetical protein
VVATGSSLSGANPNISNHMLNLSAETNTEALDEKHHEQAVVGNTIHLVWLEYKYNVPNKIYYRRSTDLGKNWDTPKVIYTVKDNQRLHNSRSNILAVAGDTVHVCIPDYDYANNGTGEVHYLRSVDNGVTFDSDRILATSGGGYKQISNSQVALSGNKLAIGYKSAKDGIHLLTSNNNGTTFKDTIIASLSEYNSELMDLKYDGQQLIILHQYEYYYYGFNVGKMYVTVSNDNGANFITNKISETYISGTYTLERSTINAQDSDFKDFQPHIAKSGNNIHIVFEEWKSPNWCTKYARSTDNGVTFETAVSFEDTSNGSATLPTIVAKNNYVYIVNKIGSQLFMKVSNDNGGSFSEAVNHFTTGFYADLSRSALYYLMPDPNDITGATVHLVGNNHFLATSANGGVSFDNLTTYSNCFNNIKMNSKILIDRNGTKHWFILHKPVNGTDLDFFYRQTGNEPEPGTMNKAWDLKRPKGINTVSMAIANSSSLQFDSAMTIEMWLKFLPDQTGSSPILLKLKEGTYYDYVANGCQISYRTNNGKVKLYSALKTDKGQFVNIANKEISDTLWHHVAYTYNANGELNNFKLFIDGAVDAQQTVTGKIDAGRGITVLGPSLSSNNYYDVNYQMDDLRMWGKELEQIDIQANMTKKDFGNEDDLKLYINFDDTFKDLSGNGNDGIPMLMAETKASNISTPISNFDVYKTLNEVTLNNKTENATTYLWNFGNNQTNTQPHPKYTYPTAGEYNITLFSKNENSVTSLTKSVSIHGLDRISPTSSGNKGYATIDIFGGGLSITNTSVWLRKEGQSDVEGEGLFDVGSGIIQTRMPLSGLALGAWDVVVKTGTSEQILPAAFTVTEAKESAPWVSISGRDAVLLNRWQTFTVNYGNKGNVDAYAVPIWFAITEDEQLEIDFLDFNMEIPEHWQANEMASEIKALGKYFITDSIDNQPAHHRVYPFMIPVIRSNTTGSLRIRVKTATNVDIHVWTNPAWLSPEDVTPVFKAPAFSKAITASNSFDPECVVKTLGMGVLDATTSVLPDVGCVWGGMKIAYTVYNHATAKANERPSIWNTIWNVGLSVTDCGVSLAKNAAFPIKWGLACINLANAAYDMRNCYLPKEGDDKKVRAVSSFDPNEMIGPNGFDTQKWIQPQNVVPYTILFENKSAATAPAHDVFIIDTLDINTFNLSDFGFDAVGWGDTIINFPQTKLREFSIDVDLRPKKELITRVSAKLDSIKGIVSWEFLSLNPTTMDLEEDPFLGFLPPNGLQHEGEGFVSFSVGLKTGLLSNHAIKNKASIIFDANLPIITNEYVNTLDLEKPQSSVHSLEAISNNEILVKWSGTDSGSGIKSYSIWVQKGNEYPEEWLFNTTETNAKFQAQAGFEYKFYSLATDNVNRTETKTDQFDAQLFFSSIALVVLPNEELSIYPNPAKDMLNLKIENAPYVGGYVMECFGMNGVNYLKKEFETKQVRDGVEVPVGMLPKGEYIVRVLYGGNAVSKKITIK